MAQPDFDFFINRAILLGAQPTQGVDPLLTAAANTFQLLDGKSSTQYDKVERKVDAPWFNSAGVGIANERALIDGTMELTPPATPGQATTSRPACANGLFSCGFVETLDAANKKTTYTPISRSIPMAAAYWYHAGTIVKALGCRGNLQGLSMGIGDRFKATLQLMGAYNTVDEAAAPAGLDYSGFPVPTFANDANSTLTLSTADGTTIVALPLWGKHLTADQGNQQKMKQYSGYRAAGITGRASVFNTLIARPAKSDADLWALRKTGTPIKLAWQTFEPDGRWSKMTVRGQLLELTPTDTDGDYTLQVTGQLIASAAGNDELAIEFGHP